MAAIASVGTLVRVSPWDDLQSLAGPDTPQEILNNRNSFVMRIEGWLEDGHAMRSFTLLLALLLFFAFTGCSKSMPHSKSSAAETQGTASYEKLSDEAQENATKLAARITAELKTLQDHPWAGLYYEGDGRGENVSLMLAPATGYLFEWHGCMGLYDRNFGHVAVKKGNLHLTFTFPNVREGFQGIADEFVPVSWGDRMYLIPADDIVGFCNDVNSGDEPRTRTYGKYLLREGDEAIQVSGFPMVSAKYKPFLLNRPIETKIVEVGNSTTRPSVCDWNFIDTTIVIGGGRSSGLLPGMELYVGGTDGVVQTVEIQTVEDDRSLGVMTQMDDDDVPIQVGWKLSTRPPWNDG